MSLTNESLQLSATDFVEFVRANPDIFQTHPELIELVSFADSRGTASLLEKQVAQLKQRLSKFQSQQFDLIEVARENEQISDSFTAIICQLIGFKNLSEFASEFPLALRKTFAIDEVSFKTEQSISRHPDQSLEYTEVLRRLAGKSAVCDNRWPSSIMSLFFSASIKSAALIPMQNSPNSKLIGVLALGSSDVNKYTHELGTAHLNRLGIMSGICLARLQAT